MCWLKEIASYAAVARAIVVLSLVAFAATVSAQDRSTKLPELPAHCENFIKKLFGDCSSLIKERELLIAIIKREEDIALRFTRAPRRKANEPAIPQLIAAYCDDEKLTTCDKSQTHASLVAVDDFAIIIAHGTYSSGQHQICSNRQSALADRKCKAIERAVADGRIKYRGPEFRQVKVSVIGHSDLFPAVASVSAISETLGKMCSLRDYKHPEDCLALARAFDLKGVISNKLENEGVNRFVTQYLIDRDPFMKTTNGYLRDSLYSILKLAPVVETVKGRLGIGNDWDSDMMRTRAASLLVNAKDLGPALEPFRSVVIILEPCGGSGIECK